MLYFLLHKPALIPMFRLLLSDQWVCKCVTAGREMVQTRHADLKDCQPSWTGEAMWRK